VYFASRTTAVATSVVVGATRAPVFRPGILAGTKHGQMNGGQGQSLDKQNLFIEGWLPRVIQSAFWLAVPTRLRANVRVAGSLYSVTRLL
jgi:ABC-type arginine transport system permease subunit